ncbi:hypothetical protein [Aquitalea sp. LB_tupeE]|uniref:hypothetical protein n=1 Tax=Aquitalea sp. LB_tupeE TaxID=2748078 RepID=UPI0015B8BFCE|nr:hypothetical protein [Aquitalea sp. LB_tupeE]NWK79820.1 hypothetical protein [Aquitalea sp. LB_tupeE]
MKKLLLASFICCVTFKVYADTDSSKVDTDAIERLPALKTEQVIELMNSEPTMTGSSSNGQKYKVNFYKDGTLRAKSTKRGDDSIIIQDVGKWHLGEKSKLCILYSAWSLGVENCRRIRVKDGSPVFGPDQAVLKKED